MDCTVNTVVPVVLYDTSGDVDVNINLKIEDFGHLSVGRKGNFCVFANAL